LSFIFFFHSKKYGKKFNFLFAQSSGSSCLRVHDAQFLGFLKETSSFSLIFSKFFFVIKISHQISHEKFFISSGISKIVFAL